MIDNRRNFQLLKNGAFRNIFLSRSVSMAGDGIADVAVTFALLEMTGTATSLGIVLALKALPTALFVLLGGVIADSYPRRLLMIGAEVTCFATQLVMGVTLISGHASVVLIGGLYLLYGLASAVFFPASSGLVVEAVTRDELRGANSLLSLGRSGASVLGPILGGILVVSTSPGVGVLADAGSFLLSAILLLGARLPERSINISTRMYVGLQQGFNMVVSTSWLRKGLLVLGCFQLLALSCLYVLGPELVGTTYGGPSAWGVLMALYGVGTFAGGALMLFRKGDDDLRSVFLWLVGTVPCLLVLGFHGPKFILWGAMLLFGFCIVTAGIRWETTMQSSVPNEHLSKVAAYGWLATSGLRPLGFGLVGGLRAVEPASTLFTVVAFAVLILTVAAALTTQGSAQMVKVPDLDESGTATS